jgi:ribosomal protein S18 acetylase RimI-like enzyme
MLIKTLETESSEEIRRCFAEAFADYVIQVDFTLERYHLHLLRYGVELEHSMGAYLDGRLVGFILNGTGLWDGKRTLYDAGTGVIPEARGRGVTEQIFLRMKEHAQAGGFEQYLLEVIQSNSPAIRIYERQGFRTVRELCCFRGAKADLTPRRSFEADPAELPVAPESFWEHRPSWQNSTDAVRRYDRHLSTLAVQVEGELAGYAVFAPAGGDVVQLAVRPDLRGRGVADSLLAGVADRCRSDHITVLNVEKGAETTRSFWAHRLQPYVDQYEMVLPLV